jgi:hypothetical protein
MRGSVRGVLRIEDPVWEGGPVATRDILWEDEGGLQYTWKAGVSPELAARRFAERSFRLRPEQVTLDTSALNPRLRVLREGMRFEPSSSVTIRGPESELDGLESELALALAPLVVSADERDELRRQVELAAQLRARGLALEGSVVVVMPIEPVAREIGAITREVSLVCLDPSRTAELERWTLPPQARNARFAITTLGLIPEDADPAAPAVLERVGTLRRFVEENLRVFVDVAELAPGGESRAVRLRWCWKDTWRAPSTTSGAGAQEPNGTLDVLLLSDSELLLDPRAPVGRNP